MGIQIVSEKPDIAAIEERLQQGDENAFCELLGEHRGRLRRMVELRLDRRLQSRIDASDVIQDAYLEAANRREMFVQQKPMPFFLWLRFLVGERLITLHRHHLGTKMRDANREISLYHAPLPEASSVILATQLVGNLTTASQIVSRADQKLRLQEALNRLEPIDREIIALRHFEHLSRDESAQALGLQPSAASKRYIRAMKRLRSMVE